MRGRGQTVVTTVRWILVLPAALALAAGAAALAVAWAPRERQDLLITVGGALGNLAAVYLGSRIAPSRRRGAAVAVAVVLLLLVGFLTLQTSSEFYYITGCWAMGILAGTFLALRRAAADVKPRPVGRTPEQAGRRYKGMTPFQDQAIDRKTFFGRGHESRSLLSLVLAERLVVLFAKSGMGKTSLLNAGLVEPLRASGYFPAVVRLADTEHGPVASVFDGIRRSARETRVDCAGGDESSLWHFFKTAEMWSEGNDLLRPVLIVDQFEELFTLHTPKRRRQLIAELAELIRGRVDRGGESTEDDRSGARPPDLKIVLALREDFLADLEELARDIPAILHHRFRLGPLTRDGARAAVVEPAALAEEAFETAPFSYREAAVNQILGFLAKRRHGAETVTSEEVEPVQLQLLCQYLEEKIRALEAGAVGELEISAADVGGERHMRRVLEGFYDRTLADVWPPRAARRVRRLCEKRLISAGGRRLTEDEEEIERKYKVSKERLRQLVDARLLRSEPRLGSAFYELSHDTLVEPILQSRKRRLTRHRRIGAVAAGVALISLGLLGVWGRTQDAIQSAQRRALLQQIQPAAPDVVFSAFWSLVNDYGVDAAALGVHLRRQNLTQLFEQGTAKVSEAQRGEAVLRASEVVWPYFEDNPDDLRAIGAVTWALDDFAGRDRSLTQRYRAARDQVLAPLREQRAAPDSSVFDWVDIPGGKFRMGSETGASDERPVREVELSAFRMLAHEVSNAEYRLFDPSHSGPDDHPAVEVSWYEAYAYAAWLGGRLPTESEWEYATRAGTTTRYWSGDKKENLERVGWYKGNSDSELHAVGQKPANAWGLYDVHGNAWEWVADWYGPYSPDPQVDPWGLPSGVFRVIRAGSFWGPAKDVRAANRFWRVPGFRDDDLGFRVVLPAAPSR